MKSRFRYNHENIIGQSEALTYVLYKVEQIAATDTTVLVLGETGTVVTSDQIHSQLEPA